MPSYSKAPGVFLSMYT